MDKRQNSLSRYIVQLTQLKLNIQRKTDGPMCGYLTVVAMPPWGMMLWTLTR